MKNLLFLTLFVSVLANTCLDVRQRFFTSDKKYLMETDKIWKAEKSTSVVTEGIVPGEKVELSFEKKRDIRITAFEHLNAGEYTRFTVFFDGMKGGSNMYRSAYYQVVVNGKVECTRENHKSLLQQIEEFKKYWDEEQKKCAKFFYVKKANTVDFLEYCKNVEDAVKQTGFKIVVKKNANFKIEVGKEVSKKNRENKKITQKDIELLKKCVRFEDQTFYKKKEEGTVEDGKKYLEYLGIQKFAVTDIKTRWDFFARFLYFLEYAPNFRKMNRISSDMAKSDQSESIAWVEVSDGEDDYKFTKIYAIYRTAGKFDEFKALYAEATKKDFEKEFERVYNILLAACFSVNCDMDQIYSGADIFRLILAEKEESLKEEKIKLVQDMLGFEVLRLMDTQKSQYITDVFLSNALVHVSEDVYKLPSALPSNEENNFRKNIERIVLRRLVCLNRLFVQGQSVIIDEKDVLEERKSSDFSFYNEEKDCLDEEVSSYFVALGFLHDIISLHLEYNKVDVGLMYGVKESVSTTPTNNNISGSLGSSPLPSPVHE